MAAKYRAFTVKRWYPPEPLGQLQYQQYGALFDAADCVLTFADGEELMKYRDEQVLAAGGDQETWDEAKRQYDMGRVARNDQAWDLANERYDRKRAALIQHWTKISPGAAVRVEYETDEGFGRVQPRDDVFFINREGTVAHVCEPKHVSVIDQVSAEAARKRTKEIDEALAPERVPGSFE